MKNHIIENDYMNIIAKNSKNRSEIQHIKIKFSKTNNFH
jgi:hypothetical protein